MLDRILLLEKINTNLDALFKIINLGKCSFHSDQKRGLEIVCIHMEQIIEYFYILPKDI